MLYEVIPICTQQAAHDTTHTLLPCVDILHVVFPVLSADWLPACVATEIVCQFSRGAKNINIYSIKHKKTDAGVYIPIAVLKVSTRTGFHEYVNVRIRALCV